jgi:hypothetical protein
MQKTIKAHTTNEYVPPMAVGRRLATAIARKVANQSTMVRGIVNVGVDTCDGLRIFFEPN